MLGMIQHGYNLSSKNGEYKINFKMYKHPEWVLVVKIH